MHQQGQWIGGHGYSHHWMSHLTPAEQKQDIQQTQQFLNQVGVSDDKMSYCYPYGAYNQDTLKLLEESRFKVGFTTQVALAELAPENRFTLHRLDTNDLPCQIP